MHVYTLFRWGVLVTNYAVADELGNLCFCVGADVVLETGFVINDDVWVDNILFGGKVVLGISHGLNIQHCG